MSAIRTLTLDPDGDLILLLDSAEEVTDTTDDSEGSSMTGESSATSTSETSEEKSEPANKVRLIVSSKHLSLASPVFKAMLGSGFKEGDQLREKGRIEVPLPDDNVAAFEILARLIHGRFAAVPGFVALPLFTQIAILVDKYQMREIVQLNVTPWSIRLGLREFPQLSWSDRLRWLCISYVLRMREEFTEVTKIICRECDRNIAKLAEDSGLSDLPIPQSVFDEIETVRQLAITNAIAQLHLLISKYDYSSTNCPLARIPTQHGYYNGPDSRYGEITVHRFHCDAMVLGCLIRSASAQRLYPQPLPPFDSYSFFSVYQGINNLEVTTACAKLSGNAADKHGVLDGLQENVKEMWESMEGLELRHLTKEK